MITGDHAEELEKLTGLRTAEGWEEIDLELGGCEALTMPAGISFRLIANPGRRILVSATWRESSASTSIVRLDEADPRAALWHAEAVNMPVSVLLAACRAALSEAADPAIARLRTTGWLRQSILHARDGMRALVYGRP